MNESNTLGRRSQEGRKAAGLSQEALGERLGVSRQAVSKWEADGAVPELENLIAMSRLFGVPVGVLLGVEEPDPLSERELAAAEDHRAAEAGGPGGLRSALRTAAGRHGKPVGSAGRHGAPPGPAAISGQQPAGPCICSEPRR